jgi:hypothetical protein
VLTLVAGTVGSAGPLARLAAQTTATPSRADELAGGFMAGPVHPFGRLNPAAPPETAQYAFMVGVFDCRLEYKAYREGKWVTAKEGRAVWTARFTMNGHAIEDEFVDEWGETNINVRLFDPARGKWRILYATPAPARVSELEASRVDGRMVMVSERTAPGGVNYTERVAFEPRGDAEYRWTQEVVYSPTSAVVIGDLACRRRP